MTILHPQIPQRSPVPYLLEYDVWRDNPSDEQVEIEPWIAVWSEDGAWPGQQERQDEIRKRIGATLGERVYLAHGADIACESLAVGDRSYVAKGCQLRDRVTIGSDCSLNPHVTLAGRVTIGDGVRIASHVAIYGFNHTFDDLDTPIWLQPLDEQGIEICDDVWIGTHVVVCDGVKIGSHSVVAAGSVVTRDVAPWAVVAGVPARTVRDRRDVAAPSGGLRRRESLERFDEVVSAQWHDAVERCRGFVETPDGVIDTYLDSPGAAVTVRATCDAIEIAAAFGHSPSLADEIGEWTLVQRLRATQDPVTGLFIDPAEGTPEDPLQWQIGAEFHHYGVLSVGYALELLDYGPSHPVHCVASLGADDLVELLDWLPWRELAWPAGSWVDFVGTAVYMNRRHHDSPQGIETLLGWLETRVDRLSGMWGAANEEWGWLMPVNGFYRLTRGTYAQYGHPLPAPEATIDTVAAHCRQNRWFERCERSACNVLDAVHALWLCARQSNHRHAEMRDQVAALLDRTLRYWVDGEGFGFDDGDPTSLQGTEMWLSTIYLMADYLGEADGLSWEPRGVHRLEPVDRLGGPAGSVWP